MLLFTDGLRHPSKTDLFPSEGGKALTSSL